MHQTTSLAPQACLRACVSITWSPPLQTCCTDAHGRVSISWLYRSVQRAVQSGDAPNPTPAPNAHAPIKPSSSAPIGKCLPDTALHLDAEEPDSEALSPATPADSVPVPASPGRHNVGLDSTWAVRQSAELEDLQAALEQQCFRRGRPVAAMPATAAATAASAAASAADVDSENPQEVQDPAGPK